MLAESLPGRDPQLAGVTERLAFLSYKRSLVGRVRVFVGPRGIGKTSLLRQAQRTAESLQFTTVWVTTGDEMPLAAALADEFHRLSRGWAESARTMLTAALKTLKVSVAGISIGVGSTERQAPQVGTGRALQDAIESAVAGVLDSGTNGLAIFIDEIQSGDDQGLKALAYAWQHIQAHPTGVPAVVFAAGLSHAQDVISKAVSFGERFEYLPLRNLDTEAAQHALAVPARELGVQWDAAAIDAVLAQTQGYPYFIQEFGDAIWQAAGYPDDGSTLTHDHYLAALADFQRTRDSMFRSRWVQVTPAEAKVLTAMSRLGDAAASRREIATQMGVDTTAISMARRSLMDKGLIESAGHGKLRFTAPGFADFIRDAADLD